jgi:predicted esterase
MMLAGFSQGGAMSLFTGLQLALPPTDGAAAGAVTQLAGLVVMSGYLPGKAR